MKHEPTWRELRKRHYSQQTDLSLINLSYSADTHSRQEGKSDALNERKSDLALIPADESELNQEIIFPVLERETYIRRLYYGIRIYFKELRRFRGY